MSLIAHYKLDGNALDSVGGYHGSASNVTWATGKLGQCANIAATGYISLGTQTIVGGTTELSFCFWINLTDFNPSPIIFSMTGGYDTWFEVLTTGHV